MADELNESQRTEFFRAWGRGLSPQTLAQWYGITASKAQEIIDAEKSKTRSLSEIDPEEFVHDHLLRVESIKEELAVYSSQEKGPGRVRAVQVRFEAEKHHFEVVHKVGIIPSDLGAIGMHIDYRATMADIMQLLREAGVPEEVLRKTADAVAHPKQLRNLEGDA